MKNGVSLHWLLEYMGIDFILPLKKTQMLFRDGYLIVYSAPQFQAIKTAVENQAFCWDGQGTC